jgi:integrase
MSHATQLHNRGYLADYIQIMNRCALPSNVQEEVYRQVHIWTRPRCQGAREWTNTLRDRCRPISGLWVKTFHGLRALMKSALPLLITTAASWALSLRRLGGSRSDLSCHQFDHTLHCAEGLLDLSVTSKICSHTCLRPV